MMEKVPDKPIVWRDCGHSWAISEAVQGRFTLILVPKQQARLFAQAVLARSPFAPEADAMDAG